MQSINRAERRRSRRELAQCPQWGTLEEFTRSRIQSWLQDVRRGIAAMFGLILTGAIAAALSLAADFLLA